MDLSNWINFNPNIKIKSTNKLFYNIHLYKLTYKLDKARFIRFLDKNRFPVFFNVNINESDLNDCILFKDVLKKNKQNLQFRIESSTLNIFSNDINLLYHLASNELSNFSTKIESISVPKNDNIKVALQTGCYVSSLAGQFKYRVITKSKFFKNLEQKHYVGNYLKNLGNEIRIGKIFLNHLNNSYKYIHQGYFYCNDKGIIDLIKLIDYNLVIRVENVVLPI